MPPAIKQLHNGSDRRFQRRHDTLVDENCLSDRSAKPVRNDYLPVAFDGPGSEPDIVASVEFCQLWRGEFQISTDSEPDRFGHG